MWTAVHERPGYISPGQLTAATAHSVGQALAPHFAGARFVLDVGAGDGDGLAPLFALGLQVVALDVDRLVLSGLDCPRVCGDGLLLPFGSGSVPAALISRVLHHLTDWRRALGEVTRVLAAGGQLALVLGPHREDLLPQQVNRHLATLLDLRLAERRKPVVTDLRESAQVDMTLADLGFGPPTEVRVTGHLITSPRQLVDAAATHPLLPHAAPADLDRALEETLTWVAGRAGGPDAELLLPTGRAYRVYRKG